MYMLAPRRRPPHGGRRVHRQRTRILVAVASAALVAAGLLAVPPAPAVAATTVEVWTRSSYHNVFRDHTRPADASTSYTLVMAKNEYESFQIVTRSAASYTINGVTFGNLVSGAGTIAASNLTANFVEYQYMSGNSKHQGDATGGDPSKDVVRVGPGWYPDPLSNATSMEVPAYQTQPVWVTLFVPTSTPTGVYTGTATLNTSAGTYPVSLRVEVHPVALPDPDSPDAGFKYMHHQQIVGNWFADATPTEHPDDIIVKTYGDSYERYTDPWWSLVRDMARRMRAHRQNVLFVNTPQLLLDSGTTVDASGNYQFRWGRFDEYIETFIREGVVRSLEGLHIGSVQYPTPDSSTWYYKTYILHRNASGGMTSASVSYDSPAAVTWLNGYLPALVDHLRDKGWLDMWHQHVGDEPANPTARTQYAWYMDHVNRLAPELTVGDPVVDMAGAQNALDRGAEVVIAIEDLYQPNQAFFEDIRVNDGKHVWVYNCLQPASGWLNRFIDKPVWQQRSLGWVLYKWGVDGFLHWGWNLWDGPSVDAAEYKGDHYTVYPEPGTTRIRGSIRWEANRDAAEDWELLNLIGKQRRDEAQAIMDTVASSATTFSWDIGNMINRRAELVRLASGTDSADSSRMRADFNGDGLDDVGLFYNYGLGHVSLWTMTARADGSLEGPVLRWEDRAWQGRTRFVSAGDFNGDGRGDVALLREHGGGRATVSTMSSTGTGFGPPTTRWDGAGWGTGTQFMTAGDFNGDNRTDIGLLYNRRGGRESLFTLTADPAGTGGLAAPVRHWEAPRWGDGTRYAGAGDFNGDGLADVAMLYRYTANHVALWTLTSDGGTFTGPVRRWDAPVWGPGTQAMSIGRFTGDTRDDVALLYHFGGGAVKLFTLAADGSDTDGWGFGNTVERWSDTDFGDGTRFMVAGHVTSASHDDLTLFVDHGTSAVSVWTLNPSPRGSYHHLSIPLRWQDGDWGRDTQAVL